MNTTDYKPNSYKFREEQKTASEKPKMEKVVKGEVKVKKKSELSKLANNYSEDVKNVKSYIFRDVLIPTLKKVLWDVITGGADILIYGGSGRGRSNSTSSKVSYRDFYERSTNRFGSDREEHKQRVGYDYDNVTLDSRTEAEEVLMRMTEIIDTYGVVSVMDFYDLIGISSNYTDDNYGWTNLHNAEPVRVRDGWTIKLPRVTPIK